MTTLQACSNADGRTGTSPMNGASPQNLRRTGVRRRRGTGPNEGRRLKPQRGLWRCRGVGPSARGVASSPKSPEGFWRRTRANGLAKTRSTFDCEHSRQKLAKSSSTKNRKGRNTQCSTTSPCEAPCCALTAWRNLKLAVQTRQVLPANAKTSRPRRQT